MSDKKFCTDCGAVNPIEGIKCHNCYSKNFGEVGIKHAVLGEYDPFKFLREENEMLKTVHESQRKDNERLIDENARLREEITELKVRYACAQYLNNILGKENEKFRKALEKIVDKYFDLPIEDRFKKELKEHEYSLIAREALGVK